MLPLGRSPGLEPGVGRTSPPVSMPGERSPVVTVPSFAVVPSQNMKPVHGDHMRLRPSMGQRPPDEGGRERSALEDVLEGPVPDALPCKMSGTRWVQRERATRRTFPPNEERSDVQFSLEPHLLSRHVRRVLAFEACQAQIVLRDVKRLL